MYSETELKQLHGQDYVTYFESRQLAVRFEKLLSNVKFESHFDAVDFGCGNGMLMDFIMPQVRSYTGVDFSEPFIASALKRKADLSITNAEFICTDIHQFCQQHPQQFDVGFALDFSEHVYDQEWVKILSSIKRSLKPNGRLYLHTPNARFFIEKMKAHHFILKQPPAHIAVRNVEDNVSLVQEAGFKIVGLKLLPHYNILRFLHLISYIPIIGKYFKARIFIEAKA
ncbi:methyltransferase domain-containing protein [Candidatus Albibeggiatoa sp. nov. BB20]|uniref:class I SAM-dependent methyltransferase n=1 Tax=Candidatus Albibeggiatoa sp. nov. BB20 TaxID=3162723 RepID=UPI00336572DC